MMKNIVHGHKIYVFVCGNYISTSSRKRPTTKIENMLFNQEKSPGHNSMNETENISSEMTTRLTNLHAGVIPIMGAD